MAEKKTPSPTPQPEPPVPVLVSYPTFTVLRCPGGWTMVTTEIQINADGEPWVVDVKKTEPNLKALALEAFKLAAFKHWTKL